MLGVIPRIKKLDTKLRRRRLLRMWIVMLLKLSVRYTALKLSDHSKNAKVILATSTVPGEGKSFVSSNLSLTFANHGENTASRLRFTSA